MTGARYQNRFVSRRGAIAIRAGQAGKPGTIVVTNFAEVRRWIQYFIDQRTRARLGIDLTDNQRKEINEACEAFEWTPDRPILIKEPIG